MCTTRLAADARRLVRATSAHCILLLSLLFATAPVRAAEQWGQYEVRVKAPASGNPYLRVQFGAVFTQAGHRIVVPGFWDGGEEYVVRFMPPAVGAWRYETSSNISELANRTGSFEVTAASPGNHGPIEVFNKFYFRYADGTPYHQFGTTCYAWVHQTRELQEQTLKTLASSPFNKLRFCVFPKSYEYNRNEPELFAFLRKPDGNFDFSRPNPVFWRHFEQRILDLQRLGIEADIILWHPYDRWGFADMSDEEDDRYLRYCIARLSAFRNVWWSLANEYDFMTERPKGHRGNKQFSDWDRFFSILENEAPFQRLRGIHNGSKWYDHTRRWVTHASLQTDDMHGGVRFRHQYGKPVVYDECKYEGDVPQGWGNLSGKEMVQRFWLGTLSGCYVGHGETYKHAQDILWWAKGGVLHGESPRRIQWLKEFMAQAPPFHELQPLGDDQGHFLLAKPGFYYLLSSSAGQPQTIHLEGERPYKLDAVDPWEMRVTPIGTAPPGDYRFTPARPDLVYRFTPYLPGEKVRPNATILASITEGIAPLKVKFTAPVTEGVHWDFGDGTRNSDSSPTHVFQNPGVYTVTLTVTDDEGGSAQSSVSIAVDRQNSEPLVRVGFSDRETPYFRLHGSAARQSDGTLHFSSGPPWGRAEAEGPIVEELRGLRSFTIMGWLKPESLQVGSGGNRIVFCLNRDRSGIDLVCLSDGRLRLAVNQWPDAVQNDSSAGRLQPGKWTFFAVSYDSTRAAENVSWYFTAPAEMPGPATPALDRHSTHNAGPVATGPGPLAIGNFNRTMEGYGYDRQFRGDIRSLQIFGSRAGSRGALTLAEISGATRLAGRVVVLGDSITYGGLWVEYLETALRLSGQFATNTEVLNLGLPSETVSGLSEPGHAGGQFSRPDLHERLERVLHRLRPDVVIACYGMNDGIYHPFAQERFEKFKEGMLRLHRRVTESGARILYLTPPVFDPEPIRSRTLPEGLSEYRQPFAGYNAVLDRYSDWLVSQRSQGWAVDDIHSEINAFLQDRRAKNPGFTLAGDGVHPGAQGHWLITRSVLSFLGVNEFNSEEDPQRAFELFPKGSELLKKVAEKQRVLKDAWLTEVGHQRPGMAKGLPLLEAQKSAAALDDDISKLLALPAFPGKPSKWHGFDRFDFPAGERTASVIVPREPLPGNPWAWKGEFLDAFPAVEVALLSNGFHIVYLSTPDMLGSPEAVRLWNLAYHDLTQRYKLAPKVALIALSRAGLYCYNWAAANPDKVACIYADAAVCDFKSWPGGKGKGKGSPRDWQLVFEQYRFANEPQALEYKFNPIDNLAPLAAAKIPLLHVYGDADDVVPWDENTGLLAERYRKLGGSITLISKPGVGHHPHGLEDPTPIVRFIQKHTVGD